MTVLKLSLHEILASLIGKTPDEESTTTREGTPPASPTDIDIVELERITHDLSQVLQRLKASCHQR